MNQNCLFLQYVSTSKLTFDNENESYFNRTVTFKFLLILFSNML